MADNYKVEEEIILVIEDCNKAIEGMSDLSEINDVISGLLKSDLWKGKSKEKCECIQTAIVTYMMSIETLMNDLKCALSVLLANAYDFESNSEKVKLINTI
ncbi:MAG: hypothetical protein E7257_03405 [Lachnospiraceae bacterium]|nr:hypothetical protein [Lachnospiraceae bacterium]